MSRRFRHFAAACLTLILALGASQSANARAFSLDGDLSDWTEADRLDLVPGTGVEGYALYGYHDAVTKKFHMAMRASQAIGAGTTFWLNTDQDEATGYQVWGFLVGAEFNINISGDGAPHLYTNADGETWVLGPLSHAYNSDKTVFEIEFDEGMVSANQPINMWADVNNNVFLPGWYGIGGYIIDAVGVPAPPAAPVNGPITLDGDLSDWSPKDRLDRLPGTSVVGYEIYGRASSQTYYIAIKTLPPAPTLGANTTIWLNTDRDRKTGYQVWGIAVGAEYNINLAADGKPHFYTGAAAQSWLTGPLPHSRSGDGRIMEIAIDRSLMDSSVLSMDVSIDVNDATFVPADFTGPGYTLYHPADLPPRATNRPTRVGIVYSATTEALYFGDKAYSQLYAAMQHQCMQAGIPYTLLTEADLTDINKIKDLDVLFMPYFANVPAAAMAEVEDTLIRAVYHYGVGLITAGNFLTNDETGNAHPGDSYLRMKHLFGLTLDSYFGPEDHSLSAGVDHPILRTYAPGESLGSYTAGYMQIYKRHFSVAQSFVDVINTTSTQPGAWAVSLGEGRSVHFSSAAVMADTDLAWRAVLWSIYGDKPWVGLQVSRHSGVFIGRCDMDQSQYVDEVPLLYPQLVTILEKWKANYNFVGSFYINVGNKPGQGETTDWSYSTPIYKSIMSLGNEIGTHSYTHPDYTTQLTEQQLTFEFKDSRDVIAKELGIDVISAAVPGNPENLTVDRLLDKYFSYVTADFSGTGAGYHGAMGYLAPDFNMVYLAPNLYFDFTMIGFLQWTPEQSLDKWRSQFNDLTAHAPSPYLVWPWHDYGPTNYEPGYSEPMFTDFLSYVADAGVEFTTGKDAAERVVSFGNTGLRVTTVDADTIKVSVDGDTISGVMAVRVESADGRTIGSVDGWPAFNGDRVLIGAGTADYVVRLTSTGATVPHISKLPMRAKLQSLTSQTPSADSGSMAFTFSGAGTVEVTFPRGTFTPSAQCGVDFTYNNNVLSVTYADEGSHSCTVSW